MNTTESELSPYQFLRIHRSVLVNKTYILKCTYKGNAEYKVEMKTGISFATGRSYKEQIIKYLSELEL